MKLNKTLIPPIILIITFFINIQYIESIRAILILLILLLNTVGCIAMIFIIWTWDHPLIQQAIQDVENKINTNNDFILNRVIYISLFFILIYNYYYISGSLMMLTAGILVTVMQKINNTIRDKVESK